MLYGFVEDGIVKEGPIFLPISWRNISGLNKMSEDSLRSLGWLPWTRVYNAGDVYVSTTIQIDTDSITETIDQRPYNESELANRTEDEANSVRADRNARLAACDWTQVDDAPFDNTGKAAWSSYRQALRDITKQPGFPWSVTWPVEPQ